MIEINEHIWQALAKLTNCTRLTLHTRREVVYVSEEEVGELLIQIFFFPWVHNQIVAAT